MNRPGNQAASWRDDAGGTILLRRSDVLAGPAFGPLSKGGLREAVGDRDFYDPSASLRSAAPFQRETSQEGVPGEGTGRIPALRPRGDPRGRLSRRAPASFAPLCALGRLPLQGQVFGGQSFSSSLMLFGTTGPACGKTAPDIRARRLGIRQPQKGSFHGMLRCPCSEYIPSIPAPVASPDAIISLFAVRSSFAGAIFRSDKIENTGNTCVYFRCFLYSMGGKEPRKTCRLPNLRAHLGLLAYGI